MYDKFKQELPYRLLDTSKYPPEVAGRFNSFITTQFDDSLSVEMQMRSIIKWATDNFKLMDSEYNDFTEYIINENINPFIDFLNDLIEYMNEFIDTFDDRYQETILTEMQKWYDDGTLELLINESLDTKYHEMEDRLTAKLTQTNIKLDSLYINVMEFGAVGDGITDDSEAIQSAITQAIASNRRIYFPNKEYVCNINTFGTTLQGAKLTGTILHSGDINKPVINSNQTLYNTVKGFTIYAPHNQVARIVDFRGSRYTDFEDLRVFQKPDLNGKHSYSAIAIDFSIEAPATWVGYTRLKGVHTSYNSYGIKTEGGLHSMLSIEDCSFNNSGYFGGYLDGVSVGGIDNTEFGQNGKLSNGEYNEESFGGLYIKGSNFDISKIWYEYNAQYTGYNAKNNIYIHPESYNINTKSQREEWSSSNNIVFMEKEIKSRNTRQIVPIETGIGKGKPLNIIKNSDFKYFDGTLPYGWIDGRTEPIIEKLTNNLPIGIDSGIRVTSLSGVRFIAQNIYHPTDKKALTNDILPYVGQDMLLTFYARTNSPHLQRRIGFKTDDGAYFVKPDYVHIVNTENGWFKFIQRYKVTGNEKQIRVQVQVSGDSVDVTNIIASFDDHVINGGGVVVTEDGGTVYNDIVFENNSSVTIRDKQTDNKYKIIIENGVLGVEEVSE